MTTASTTALTTGPGRAAAAHPLADELVLAFRPLRPGTVLSTTPRFAEDRWNVTAAVLQAHQCSVTFHFETVPGAYRSVAKELVFAMLIGPPPGESCCPRISTIQQILSSLRTFLTWLADHTPAHRGTRHRRTGHPGIGHVGLADLTGADLEAFAQYLHGEFPTSRHARSRRRIAVQTLWRYRHALLTDRLPFDPRHLHIWTEMPAGRARENTTDRIPEQVLGPLVAWCLRFVDEFSGDILAADQLWRHQRAVETGSQSCTPHNVQPGTQHNPQHGPGDVVRDAPGDVLGEFLAEHLDKQRPLPGWNGTVNIRFLAAHLGLERTGLRRRLGEINQVAQQVGITPYAYYNLPITGDLDGRPWLEEIATDHCVRDGVAALARMLQVAAYTLIAFFGGMRDSEIKHLRRDCLTVQRDADGRPYRWKVTSLAFKGETDAAGVEATWVVGHPAARAVAVLHRLQPDNADFLFARLAHSPGAKGDVPVTALSTNNHLNELIDWINHYCHTHDRTDGIPLVNNRAWRLSTRQFRRTLAWFIARRPGGAIAGAIAFRHHAIQMFEGYAGTSDSGFRAEVESEQALARGEDLLAMIDVYEHADEHRQLTGPAAAEAHRRLAEFGDQARFAGTVLTDAHRLARLMRREDPAIYPGTFATCVFQPDKALCQQHRDSRGTTQPGLGNCRPLECANVALTADNLAALRAELNLIDDDLAIRPSLPPLLSHRLSGRRDQIVQFLDRHTPETT